MADSYELFVQPFFYPRRVVTRLYTPLGDDTDRRLPRAPLGNRVPSHGRYGSFL